MALAPFRCAPRFLDKPWGSGARLRQLGVPAPAGTGEVWLVSDVEGTPSTIRDGPWSGRTLRELVEAEPEAVLGHRPAAGEPPRFPLLIKLLEVAGRLSVQVHPDGPTARALGHGERGKSEAWFVLAVGPDGEVGLGLGDGLSPDALLREASRGTLPERMRRFVPAVGEAIEILPGTFHFARDLLFLEVQETSDVTYRVWDWGSSRSLHLAEAAECLRRIPPAPPGAGSRLERELEVAPRSPFRFRVLRLAPGERLLLGGGLPRVVVPVEGRVELGGPAGGDGLALAAGEAAVAPAAWGQLELRAATAAGVALAWPQPSQPERAPALEPRRVTVP